MKNFTQVNNSQDILRTLEGLKSRIRPLRYAFAIVVMMMCFGVQEAWGSDCNYTLKDQCLVSYTEKSNSWRVPEFDLGYIENEYGISHVTVKGEFTSLSGMSAAQHKFKLQYKIGIDGTYTDFPSASDVKVGNSEKTIYDNDVTIAATPGRRVYLHLYTSDGGIIRFNNKQTFEATVSVRMAKSLSVSSSDMDFEDVSVGSNKPLTRDVSFSCLETGKTMSVSVSNTTDYSVSLSSAALDCSGTRTVTVTFNPSSEGEKTGTVTISSNNGASSVSFDVTGNGVAVKDPEYTWNGETEYEIGNPSLNLSALWESESGATKSFSIKPDTWVPEDGVPTDGATAPSITDGYLSLGQAGTLTIVINQPATSGYKAGSDEQEITIKRRTPEFTWNTQAHYYYNSGVSPFVTKTSGGTYTVTSNNTEVVSTSGDNVTIYNKPGTASIRVHHPETYYWEEYDHSESITPEWRNDTVSFSLTDANHTIYESANTFSSGYAYWNNDKNGYFLGATSMGEVSTKRENYAIIHFTGIPDTLYFDQKLNKYVVLPKDRVCYVMVSANGSTWNDTVWRQEAEIEYMNNQKVCLPSSTRYIKFYYNGTISSEYKNIRVSKRKYFKTDKASLDFATNVKNASCDAQTFKFHHASAGYITSVSSSDSHFTVSPVSVTTGGEICDSAVITVSYSTAEVGEHSGTITISDNIGNSTSVSVTGTTVDAYTPTITWPGATSYLVGSTIANSFVAKDNNEDIISGTWSFESSDSTVIDVVEGELKAICGGTATITGTIAEGATWSSGSQTVSLTVTRNAASFTWSNVADDDKIHVWADSDIPSSIVSANTAINGLTSGNSDRLTVSGSKGSFSLHAGHKGEVTLTATSEGDCTYSSGTSSKTIVVEPCYHNIVWTQNFIGLMADEKGDIDTTITLTAYAVDSSSVATNKTITYTLDDYSFASIVDGNKLHITGAGSTTIYARTADDNKYAIAETSLSLRVRVYGEACNTYLAYDKDQHKVSTYTNNKGKVYSWDGPADSIFVKVGKQSSITTQSLHIYTYDKNGNETNWQDWGVGSLSSEGENKRLKLPEGTVKIKFQGSGTQYKWYSDLIVTQKRYFTANKSSINRSVGSPVPVNMVFSDTITVSYSDVPLIQYSYTGQYLTLTPLQTIENDCGNYGTYRFALSGVFPKVGSHNEHIYFRTSAGDEIDIPVTITVTTNGAFYFNQTTGEWGESTNWTYGSETTHGMTPTIANEVIIEKNVTIVGEVSAYNIMITNGATVTIAPNGGLTVGAGGIRYSTKDNLILQAGTEDPVKGKTGYLRISPHYTDTMPHAKVELYSIAYHNISSDESDDAKWQHVGIPVATDALAKTFFSKSWIYSYEESSDTWVNNRKTLVMEPFVGYATTQYKSDAGMLVTFPGQLVPNRGTKIIDLEYSGTSYGHNRIANSYAAPIDITQFRDTDFIRAEKTIYIYNTGSKNNSSQAKSATGNNAGQWTAVSIGTAAEMAERFAEDPSLPKTIAPMQGFCVNAQAEGAKFKLNYNKLVWNADYSSHAPTALRAPKRNADAAEEEEMPITGSMKMTLEANGLTDNIYLLESERYMADFEDGYDAHKMESGTLNIFTVENEDKLAIDATNSIIGTRVGVRTGEETAYTITFSYVDGEQEWALYDAETDEMIDITNDNTYTFFAEPNSNITERFMIVESNGAQIPAVTTGNDKVTSNVRAHKFIKDGELFILKNGVLYDVTGARVK